MVGGTIVAGLSIAGGEPDSPARSSVG